MNSKELFTEVAKFFPNNPDLMRHLNEGACWEYIITEKSTNEEDEKLHFFLYKKNENTLEIMQDKPHTTIPDLILYFTEKAVLELIQDNPDAEEYYSRYRNIMMNPQNEVEVDNKINKSRLKLLKLGYRNWQNDFKF